MEDFAPAPDSATLRPTLRELFSDELYYFCAPEEETELERLKKKTVNPNTNRTTSTWVNRFEQWRVARDMPRPLADIERKELDSILQLFYSSIKKENGEDYEPCSLRTMLVSLDRYLREQKRPFSILQDKEFEESRKVSHFFLKLYIMAVDTPNN